MVICQQRGADLHLAQLLPLPLTVSCFSKIQIGLTFLVPAHPGRPGKRAVKRVCDLNRCISTHSDRSCWQVGTVALGGPAVIHSFINWIRTACSTGANIQCSVTFSKATNLGPNLQNILRQSYDSAKVTIDLRPTSSLPKSYENPRCIRYNLLAIS